MTARTTGSSRYLLRPAGMQDLDDMERFAIASAHGITTLPADRDALATRLERSVHAFTGAGPADGGELYLFVVEDRITGRLAGTSGIEASAGFRSSFYAFRNEVVVQASPTLGRSNRLHTLRLCNDLTGVTLLTSFYVDPDYSDTVAAQLLSRGRLVFIAQFAHRFSDRIAAETPGLADDAGRCPFWDAVGRRFFDTDYPAIERLTAGRTKGFIGELMPALPIYVTLLSEEAQWAIGQLHPVGELPFSILLDEGFDPDTYVDIFDGGPIVQARVQALKTVANSTEVPFVGCRDPVRTGVRAAWHLVGNTSLDAFRVTCIASDRGDVIHVGPDVAGALGVTAGDTLRVAPLEVERGGRSEPESPG